MKVVWCLGAAVPNPFLASLWIGSGLGWPEGDLGRQLPDPRLLSYDSYDLPDAESEREIVRIHCRKIDFGPQHCKVTFCSMETPAES